MDCAPWPLPAQSAVRSGHRSRRQARKLLGLQTSEKVSEGGCVWGRAMEATRWGEWPRWPAGHHRKQQQKHIFWRWQPPVPEVTDLYPMHRTRAVGSGGPGLRLGRSPAEWTCKKTRENWPARSGGHPQRWPPHLLLGGAEGRTHLQMQQGAEPGREGRPRAGALLDRLGLRGRENNYPQIIQ